ncbi:hypothetical protein [Paludisphaera soli]|uniref:hypothetical protein n=1 Tax=Paludisphaera soli TaxID=2712865 RepID=UPI0013E9AA03|nr:hypothetical protein [Paludisphaera soli]
MTRERPPIQVPATPEYVLATLQDQHRHLAGIYEADADAVLTAEMSIIHWCAVMDLGDDWRRLSWALDDAWKLGRSRAEWKAVLEPTSKRTLGGLCAFIAASGATRPVIEPFGFLGVRPCRAAGAFLAVRSALREADAIAPETPLGPFLQRHVRAFGFSPIPFLAPGALPPLSVDLPPGGAPLAGFALGSLLASAVGYAGFRLTAIPLFQPILIISATLFLMSFLALGSVLQSHRPNYELGDLRTFKDLARALAAGAGTN